MNRLGEEHDHEPYLDQLCGCLMHECTIRSELDIQSVIAEMRRLCIREWVSQLQSDLLKLRLESQPDGIANLCGPISKCFISRPCQLESFDYIQVMNGLRDLLSRDFDGHLLSLFKKIQSLTLTDSDDGLLWNSIASIVKRLSHLPLLDSAKNIELCQTALQNISLMSDSEILTNHVTSDLRKLSFG